jgi:hypothetical protein
VGGEKHKWNESIGRKEKQMNGWAIMTMYPTYDIGYGKEHLKISSSFSVISPNKISF